MRGVMGCYVAALLLVAAAVADAQTFTSPWTFVCEGTGDSALCVKKEAGTEAAQSLNHCKLICGTYGSLWPRPSGAITLGGELTLFTTAKITNIITSPKSVESLLTQNVQLFINHLDMYHPDYSFVDGSAPWSVPADATIAGHELHLDIRVSADDDRLSLTTDESYNLSILPSPTVTTAFIEATTFFGARHAIETLSQLINYNEENDCLQIVNTVVIQNDAPFFPYRGIIVDTSRNYVKLADIRRTIDAMSTTKLNTFHWHITDSQSFPFVMESLPKMHQYGAYSSRHLYYPDEIRALVEYGRVRGIRVLPEFDAPAHVGSGYEWGPDEGLGNLAVCIGKEPWMDYCVEPPCGQLNLANENMYGLVEKIYAEFIDMFQPLDLFHYGGDEVNLNCWNTTDEIIDWMKTRGDGSLSEERYLEEWSLFQDRVYNISIVANKGVAPDGIIWTSSLTEKGQADLYLDKNKYIIQIWTTGVDPIIGELLEKDFRLIFSNYDALYLDCGYGAWVGEGNNWCSPYIGWQKVYENNPLALAVSPDYHHLVMGAEAALWSEQVDETGIDAKLWPRGAAMAERLWANPSSDWYEAEPRMVQHRERMVERGIDAERLQPEWCRQNEGLCYL